MDKPDSKRLSPQTEPKEQDREDIKTRARIAQMKTIRNEGIQRANIAFSKLMIYHRSHPEPLEKDEVLIDQEMNRLIDIVRHLSSSSSAYEESSIVNEKSKEGSDVLHLLLTAARLTIMRRMARYGNENTTFMDPYVAMLQLFPKSSMYFTILLDYLDALLILSKTNFDKTQDEDRITDVPCYGKACDIAERFLDEFKTFLSVSTKQSKNIDQSTTLLPSKRELLCDKISVVVDKSRNKFGYALSIFRHFKMYKYCIRWSDYLLDILELSYNFSENCVHHADKKQTNGKIYASKQEVDKTISEVLAIKAFALSSFGDTSKGLATARKAWKKCSCNPSTHNLATLFHCAVLRWKETMKKGSPDVTDPLLELDDAIASFIEISKTLESNETPHEKLLEIFPVLANSCVDDMSVTLGIQQRWIELFVRTESVLEVICNIDGTTRKERILPSGISLLSILQNNLYCTEEMLSKDDVESNFPARIQLVESADQALEDVLNFILKMCKCVNDSSTGSTATDNKIIWEDRITHTVVGDHKTCVWIAEQLWNLSIQFSSIEETNETSIGRYIAAQLFAKAHDFALLSEEEESYLTEGHLDIEHNCWPCDKDVIFISFDHDGAKKCSELCSEFSAQCMILAVANMLDFHATRDFYCHGSLDPNEYLNRSLFRLTTAKNEFDAISSSADANQHTHRVIAWLALRCLVELGDDNCCIRSLDRHNLASYIQNGLFSDHHERESSRHQLQVNDSSQSNISPVSHLYLVTCRAENRGMIQTAKFLFTIIAKNLSEKRKSIVDSDGKTYSLGFIQKKMLKLATSAREVIKIFADVDSIIHKNKQCSDPNKYRNGDNESKEFYSIEEIDFFTVEAYNRGITLMHIGDLINAEKLVATALNYLTWCGREIQLYGAEMRHTYRSLIERKESRLGLSISPEEIIGLFENRSVK